MTVTGPLREYAHTLLAQGHRHIDINTILMLCDRVDEEHARRVEQGQREIKRAFARYLRAVTTDYENGIKRKRGSNDG